MDNDYFCQDYESRNVTFRYPRAIIVAVEEQ